jgi:hypothetical protein
MTFPRVRALIFVAVLFVTAGVVVLTAINRDSQTKPAAAVCEPGQVRVNVDVLDEEQVVINLYNGSSHLGLAEQISSELANRGFIIGKVEAVPPDQQFAGVGSITYGPGAVGAAWLVQAYFLAGELDDHYVPDHDGPAVDLVLGNSFQQLATLTEVNQRIAALKAPKPPPGTCPGLPLPTLEPTPTDTPSAAPTS